MNNQMPKYSSTSKNLIQEAVLGIAFLIIILVIIFPLLTTLLLKIVGITITLSIIAFIVYDARKNTFTIEFREEEVLVKYNFIAKTFHIPYNTITEVEYIKASKSPIINRLKFKTDTKNETIKYLSIAYENYIDFTKWLKSKNEKIEFTVYPSDNYMNHKLQEIHGFKYRKFLKNTL